MLLSKNTYPQSKNYVIFTARNNKEYIQHLSGDDVLNIFNRPLMNIYLERFEDDLGIVGYDDITHMSTNENHSPTITDLPTSLVTLTILNSVCHHIFFNAECRPKLNAIFLNKTNLSAFPDLRGCTNLRSLKINFANISQFHIDYDLPTTLFEFSLANNCISNVNDTPFSYDKIQNLLEKSKFIKISLSDNYLKADVEQMNELIKRKCNILRQHKYRHQLVSFHNVGRDNVEDFFHNAFANTEDGNNRNILDTSQTVHLTSINKSVIDTFEVIKKYIKDNDIEVVELSIHENKYLYLKSFSALKRLLCNDSTTMDSQKLFEHFIHSNNKFLTFFDTKFELTTTIHAMTKLTYKRTFEHIWAVFVHLVRKSNDISLLDRLKYEIEESNGTCFTGCYNRMFNALVGLIDNVYVGISSKEELQMEFTKLIQNLNNKTKEIENDKDLLQEEKKEKKKDIFSNCVCEAKELLKQKNLNEAKDWLEALYDHAPDPESIEINKNYYHLHWDNLITDYRTTDIVGQFVDGSYKMIQ